MVHLFLRILSKPARILAEWHLPGKALVYALLHDVPEDTEITFSSLEEIFGKEIVSGLQKISVVKKGNGTQERELRDTRLRLGLYQALIEDPLVVLARLAERLHNLRTIDALKQKKPESARKTAEETLRVYLPIVEKLGLEELGEEMARLSLTVLDSSIEERIRNLPLGEASLHAKIVDSLCEACGRVDSTRINFTPFSWQNHWETLLSPDDKIIFSLRRFGKPPVFSLNYLVDDPFSEIPLIIQHILSSRRFVMREEDWWRYGLFLAGKGKSFECIFFPIENNSFPFRVVFLPQDMRDAKEASVLDIFRVGEPISEERKRVAEEKLAKAGEILREALAQQPRHLPPDVFLREAIQGRIVTLLIEIGQERYEISLTEDSTYLDFAAEVLGNDVIFLQGIESSNGTRLDLNEKPRNRVAIISLKVDYSRIQARPGWFDAIDLNNHEIRRTLTKTFRRILDGKDLGGVKSSDLVAEVASLAEKRGRRIIENLFFRLTGIPLDISIVRGFDESLKEEYGGQPYEFLQAVGIEEIPSEVLEKVVRNLKDFRDSLATIEVYVSQTGNRPGWSALVNEVLASFNLNICVGMDREEVGVGVSAIMLRMVELPPEGQYDFAWIKEFLEQVAKKINQRCVEKGFDKPVQISVKLPPKFQGKAG